MAGDEQSLQAHEVLRRIQQSIGVIDSQPADQALRQKLADELVSLCEYPRILHAKSDQIVDVEETPVVDLLARYPPESQPVRLRLQKPVQSVEAVTDRRECRSASAELDSISARAAADLAASRLQLIEQ